MSGYSQMERGRIFLALEFSLSFLRGKTIMGNNPRRDEDVGAISRRRRGTPFIDLLSILLVQGSL